jgi:hypothetical protein
MTSAFAGDGTALGNLAPRSRRVSARVFHHTNVV